MIPSQRSTEVIVSFLLFLFLVFENVETDSKGELRERERGRRFAEVVTLGQKREKARTSISQRKSPYNQKRKEKINVVSNDFNNRLFKCLVLL